jgi:hypothetical protein
MTGLARGIADLEMRARVEPFRGVGMSTGAEVRRQTGDQVPSISSEFVQFLAARKKWWLAPMVIIFALITLLVVFSGTGATPFIYSMD